MIFFITVLRALAACLITNSHYTGIYPTDLIANGGLLGDVLFFAVSGYCLVNVKQSFPRWYGKRLWRIYPPVLLITAIYLLIGAYSLQQNNLFWWCVYPTAYHFVASILLLYIPFYLCMKVKVLKNNLPKVMLGVAVVWVLVYVLFYDKSYYHIDNVRQPMIWFLFFEAMLMGAYFRVEDQKFRNRFHVLYPILAVLCFGIYFASKIMLSKYAFLAAGQILNQVILFVLLYFIFRLACSLDAKLEKLPTWLKKCISFVSNRTLEIYIVQSVLIEALRTIGAFPINWIAVTAAILVAATLVHLICEGLYKLTDYILLKLYRK